jgi:hypothetical protein
LGAGQQPLFRFGTLDQKVAVYPKSERRRAANSRGRLTNGRDLITLSANEQSTLPAREAGARHQAAAAL